MQISLGWALGQKLRFIVIWEMSKINPSNRMNFELDSGNYKGVVVIAKIISEGTPNT